MKFHVFGINWQCGIENPLKCGQRIPVVFSYCSLLQLYWFVKFVIKQWSIGYKTEQIAKYPSQRWHNLHYRWSQGPLWVKMWWPILKLGGSGPKGLTGILKLNSILDGIWWHCYIQFCKRYIHETIKITFLNDFPLNLA